MDKRTLAKVAAKIVVTTAIGSLITKTLVSNVPATQKFKIADMSGGLGAWVLGDLVQPKIDEMIDNFFDRREANQPMF